MGEGERERKVTMATRGFPMAAEREERGEREKKKSGFGVLLISERKPNKMKKKPFRMSFIFFYFPFLFYSVFRYKHTHTHMYLSIKYL